MYSETTWPLRVCQHSSWEGGRHMLALLKLSAENTSVAAAAQASCQRGSGGFVLGQLPQATTLAAPAMLLFLA